MGLNKYVYRVEMDHFNRLKVEKSRKIEKSFYCMNVLINFFSIFAEAKERKGKSSWTRTQEARLSSSAELDLRRVRLCRERAVGQDRAQLFQQ